MNDLGPLNPDLIRRNLTTRLFGRRIVYYEQAGSTNDIAKQLAEAGEPEGTLIIADEQTAGRGRMQRTWVAPPRSSILMSLILRPPFSPNQLGRVAMMVGLGTCDAVRAETGLDALIKWPNDLVIRGKKCAGILSEVQIGGDKIEYVVAGLGLNVNVEFTGNEHLPEATSLAIEWGRQVSREALVAAILAGCESLYARQRAGESLRADYLNRSATVGHEIVAYTPWGEERGVAEDVDDEGALILRRPDGSATLLFAADVTLSPRR